MLVNNLPVLPTDLVKNTDAAAKDKLGLIKTTSEVSDVSKGYSPVAIVDGVAYYKDAAEVTLETLGVTATAEELNNIAGTTEKVTKMVSDAQTAATDAAKTYTDGKITDLINGAPETMDTLGEIATAFKENKDVVDALNAAITNKADKTALEEHVTNKENPHGVTAEQVGLGKVENKSVAEIFADMTAAEVNTALGYTAAKDAAFGGATAEAAGSAGLVPAPTTDDATKFLKADGKWSKVTASDVGLGKVENKTAAEVLAELTSENVATALGYTAAKDAAFTAATEDAAGTAGLVPAPAVGDGEKFLKADGTWASIKEYTAPTASKTAKGEVQIGDGIDVDASGVISVAPTVTVSDKLTLTAAGWADNSQSVLVALDTTKRNVIDVDASSLAAWVAAGVQATAESATGVTFTCTSVPTADLKLRVTSFKI